MNIGYRVDFLYSVITKQQKFYILLNSQNKVSYYYFQISLLLEKG